MSNTATATTPTTTIPVTLIYPGGEDISDIDIADPVVISDTVEQIDVGGAGILHGTYLRITGPDLVAAFEALRRLCDRGIDAVLDARQARIEAERHDCYCGTRLEPDEETCRAPRCERAYAEDRQL